MKLIDTKLDIKDFIKGIGFTVTICALYFGVINKLDKLDAKIDSLNSVSDKDKEIIYLKLAQLDKDFAEGKEKYNREMSAMTNRVLQIYGLIPRETKIEDEIKQNVNR